MKGPIWWRVLIAAGLLFASSAGLLSGCTPVPPVKIGFVGTMMGRCAELTLDARDGVMLAIEQQNDVGGINGRPVELLVYDDQQDPQIALEVNRKLVSSGVAVVINHSYSTINVKILNEINRLGILSLSPVAGATALAGHDDYFFMMHGTLGPAVSSLVRETTSKNLKKASVIYDLSNQIYTQEWFAEFKRLYEQNGGEVVKTITYYSRAALNLSSLALQLLDSDADLVLAIGNSYDTAILFQQIRNRNRMLALYTTELAMTNDFLEYGGPAVEGVTLAGIFDPYSSNVGFVGFKKDYYHRFNTEPSGAAVLAFETARLFMEVLTKSHATTTVQVKKAILEQRVFQGLQGPYSINRFGDARRDVTLSTVRDRNFRRCNDAK
ncbi:MAG TPA: ABC transporter substrate-binding protein [Bacillota bacterium]|nr:ABC transporter substrate-binding protein [Bacillota bacterium]